MNNSTAGELLLQILHPSGPANLMRNHLTPVQWHALIALAEQQRIAAQLYQRLIDHGLLFLLPAAAAVRLRAAYRTNAMRNLNLYSDLVQFLKALQVAAIPAIVLKGTYLAHAVYPNLAQRYMVDFDLMVYEDALPTVIEIAATLGYHPIAPVILDNSKALHHHLPRFVKPHGVASVEIHWTITRPDQAYTITMAGLWERAQPFSLPGVTSLALSHEDLLLHLCLHATYHHHFLQGVRPLCDITETVSRYGETMDWDALCQRAQAWGWSKGVYLALYLAKVFLNAAIPEPVLTALEPAHVSPQLVAIAKTHLFAAYEQFGTGTSSEFMQVVGEGSLPARLRLLWHRMFLSRPELAYVYHLPVDSPKLPLYHFVRLWELLLRYRRLVWQWLCGDAEFSHTKRQRNDFIQWLEQG